MALQVKGAGSLFIVPVKFISIFRLLYLIFAPCRSASRTPFCVLVRIPLA